MSGGAPAGSLNFDGTNIAQLVQSLQPYSGSSGRGYGQFGQGQLSWGSQGNPFANQVWALVHQLFPATSFGGMFVDKAISGSNTVSQHAYGNAVDIMVPSIAVGNQIYQWLQQNWPAASSPVYKVLWDPAGSHGNVVGAHTNHLHVEFDPYYAGRPVPNYSGQAAPPPQGGNAPWGGSFFPDPKDVQQITAQTGGDPHTPSDYLEMFKAQYKPSPDALALATSIWREALTRVGPFGQAASYSYYDFVADIAQSTMGHEPVGGMVEGSPQSASLAGAGVTQ
jgi:hypothetical protein